MGRTIWTQSDIFFKRRGYEVGGVREVSWILEELKREVGVNVIKNVLHENLNKLIKTMH